MYTHSKVSLIEGAMTIPHIKRFEKPFTPSKLCIADQIDQILRLICSMYMESLPTCFINSKPNG